MATTSYTCDACKLDGSDREANYFCTDCHDYMCDKCESYHRKVKITRLHTVLSGDKMPRRTGSTGVKMAEVGIPAHISTVAVEDNAADKDATPAEDNFDWDETEAEEFNTSKDRATTAEDFGKGLSHLGVSFLNIKLTPQTSMNLISIKHPADNYEPLVTGLAFLNSGELLVTDYNNKCLKLLDSTLKVRQTLECPGIPYGVAVISEKEAIVTFPLQRNVVQFLTLTPTLKLGRCVPMNNGCWGVAVSKTNIYIACNANAHREEVVVMDFSGKILKVIDIGKIISHFGDMKHIAINGEGDKLYLSGTSKILCMSSDGQRIFFTCTAAVFGMPRGLLTDGYDNVLVCCHGTNKILVVTSDGKKSRPLLTSKDGVHDPKAIAYRNDDGLLVIGGWKKYNLLVFNIK